MSPRALTAAVLAALLLAGACSSGSKKPAPPSTSSVPPATAPAQGAAPWPAPPNAMALAAQAGLTPETAETLQHHVHAHLDVFLNGSAMEVPAGIGIAIDDPGVHKFDENGVISYGGITVACGQPCISPLHTHGPDGILHTESRTPTPNTLGQFFTEWAVRLDRQCVGGYCRPGTSVQIFVNGARFTGDPTTIQLDDRTEIAIVIGTPPTKVPKTVPF